MHTNELLELRERHAALRELHARVERDRAARSGVLLLRRALAALNGERGAGKERLVTK